MGEEKTTIFLQLNHYRMKTTNEPLKGVCAVIGLNLVYLTDLPNFGNRVL